MKAIQNLSSSVDNNFTDVNAKLDDALSRLTNTEGGVNNLSECLAVVEGKLERCESSHVDVNSISNKRIDEINNRLERKCNLVLFGFTL